MSTTPDPEDMSARELLATLLGGGIDSPRALRLADAVLREYGGLNAVARARIDELVWIRGIGIAKAAALVAAFGLTRRAQIDPRAVTIKGPADIARASRQALLFGDVEHLVLLVANANNRVIHSEIVSMGGGDHTLMPMPESLGIVLRRHGRGFALAHNHPCGDTTPSEADRQATARIAVAADVLGLYFLGHVVVSDKEWCPVPLTPSAQSQWTPRVAGARPR
jgi:DNA repair protein RadC